MSEATTIFSTAMACHYAFKEATSCSRLMHQEWAENRLADFNLWSSGAGASTTGKASLDRRLRANPEARTILVNLLLMLKILVQKCIDGGKETAPSTIELSSGELARMKDVEASLNQLTRLTVAIRKAGVRSRLQKADGAFDPASAHICSLRLHLETILLAKSDKDGSSALSAQQLDPTQLTSIQLRLIDANLRRRNRFLYAQKHSRRLGINSDDTNITPSEKPSAISQPLPLGIGKKASPSQQEVIPLSKDVQAQSTTTATMVDGQIEFPPERVTMPATTVVSVTSSRITYPRPPLLQDRQMLFKCPCCCQTLPVAVSRGSHWKKHLMGDVLPYTCILEDCSKANTFYMTREAWLSHMQNDHESTEQWVCQACSQKNISISFQGAADFTAHLQQQHDKRIKPQQIPMLHSAWRRKVSFEISACPLCRFDSDDKNALLDHTAEHIHSFSLRALPWAPDENLEESKESSQEAEYFETHPYFDIGSTQSEPSSASFGLSSSSTRSLQNSPSIRGFDLDGREHRDRHLNEEEQQQQLTGDALDQMPHDISDQAVMGNWLQQLDDGPESIDHSGTYPFLTHEDSDGLQWLTFEYSRLGDHVKMEYTVRCDIESVNVGILDQHFKMANCVYPEAFVSKDQHRGGGFNYETNLNVTGWALAVLNPALRGKPDLIQRALESWRQINDDPRLRSRLVRRIDRLCSEEPPDSTTSSSLEGQMETLDNPDSSPAPSALPPSSPSANREDGPTKENTSGIWGRLVSLDDSANTPFAPTESGIPLCNESGNTRVPGSYLFGRDPECDIVIDRPEVSNRHFLIFSASRRGRLVAILADLSTNGVRVNGALVGRNNHRFLEEGDEISLLDYSFGLRYHTQIASLFSEKYEVGEQLGKSRYATVSRCIDHATGKEHAVRFVEKHAGGAEVSYTQLQEASLLMSVNHPNIIFLKDTFYERDGGYLVLELARGGELDDLLISKPKLSEAETRHVFSQLFECVKYLHYRDIVHRNIAMENILMADEKLTVKLGGFSLATTIRDTDFVKNLRTLTPSYPAPELLQNSRRALYTKAVDVWSLGVTLYICLCGFPPFSDELYTKEYPYTLSQQIKMGRYHYPSPYWDSVGDPALDLIDSMLTVDAEKRITVDECLEHPWMTGKYPHGSETGFVGEKEKSGPHHEPETSNSDSDVNSIQNDTTGGTTGDIPYRSRNLQGDGDPVEKDQRSNRPSLARQVKRKPTLVYDINEVSDPDETYVYEAAEE